MRTVYRVANQAISYFARCEIFSGDAGMGINTNLKVAIKAPHSRA